MTRRVVRLLVLLGVVVAAFFVLSFFDHAAHADTGAVDRSVAHIAATVPVDAVVAGAESAVPQPPAAPKARPPKIVRPVIKVAELRPAKVVVASRTKVPAKVRAASTRAGETVRRVQVRTSTIPHPALVAVRDVARATVTSARAAVVRPELPIIAPLSSLPRLAGLPDLAQAELPGGLQLPGLQLPGLPQAQLPGLTPAPARTAASAVAPVPHQSLMPPVFAQTCQLPALAPASELPGVTTPPAARAQPRTPPLPASPRPPADHSTFTGQARNSGGGTAPAKGTFSSSWRPEVTAPGCRRATDLIARGRTARYAGPPS